MKNLCFLLLLSIGLSTITIQNSTVDQTVIVDTNIINTDKSLFIPTSKTAGFWSDWWDGFVGKTPKGIKVPRNG